MRPGVLLPDPVWNLTLVRWMDLRTIFVCSWQDKLQRNGCWRTREATEWPDSQDHDVLVFPGSPGELCPLEPSNPVHDGREPRQTCQVLFCEIKKISSSGLGI